MLTGNRNYFGYNNYEDNYEAVSRFGNQLKEIGLIDAINQPVTKR